MPVILLDVLHQADGNYTEAKAKGLLKFDDWIMTTTQFLSLIRGERPLLLAQLSSA